MPNQPPPRQARSTTAPLVLAIVITMVAILQWALLAATKHPSTYGVLVPFCETFAATMSWVTFLLVRRANSRL